MDSRRSGGTLRSMTTDANATDCEHAAQANPWRMEIEVAIRDGLACRICELALVEEDVRRFVRVDPAGADEPENIALVCERCQRDHRDHPRPIPAFGERIEPLT